MAAFDIQGSLAHAEMLCAQKIISTQDLADIMRGLKQISEEIANDSFDWQIALEDVHMNIERRLTDLIGDAGKRLHTGRSRNDQVATDIRLYMRSAIDDIDHLLHRLCESLLNLAEKHFDTILPGFTHMQVAQPVTFGHHLLAYAEMFNRDIERLRDCENASIVSRWAPLHWQARHFQSIGKEWRKRWNSKKCAAIRWTRFPIGISLSSSAPMPP